MNDLEPLTADRFLPLCHPTVPYLCSQPPPESTSPRPHSSGSLRLILTCAVQHFHLLCYVRYNFGTLLHQQPSLSSCSVNSAPSFASQTGISPVSLLCFRDQPTSRLSRPRHLLGGVLTNSNLRPLTRHWSRKSNSSSPLAPNSTLPVVCVFFLPTEVHRRYDKPRPPFPPSFPLLLLGAARHCFCLSAERLLVLVAFFLSFLPTFSAFTPALSCGLSWVEGIPHPSIRNVSPLPPLPTLLPISSCACFPPLPPLSCLSHIHPSCCLNCAPFSFIYLPLLHLSFISCASLLVT